MRPNGVAVIQTPIDRYGEEPPFAGRFEHAFDDVQHTFIFSERAMAELASRSSLSMLDATARWIYFHEICVLAKPE
jgi:hypothetical protein